MAKAEKSTKTRKVQKVVEVEVAESVFKLELNEYEAKALLVVLYRIGGSPEGPRGQLEKISKALESAGLKAPGRGTDELFDFAHRTGIIFQNLPEEEFNRIYKNRPWEY